MRPDAGLSKNYLTVIEEHPRQQPKRATSLNVLVRRNDWQQDVRGSGGIGEDAVAGDARVLPLAFRLARIRVDVEMGKLLLEMSSLRRCPRQNRLAIGNSSMVIA